MADTLDFDQDLAAGLAPASTAPAAAPKAQAKPQAPAASAPSAAPAVDDDLAAGLAPVRTQRAGSFATADRFVEDIEGGYVANDAGAGETKYGVNKRANPDVDVKNLTPDGARDLRKARYWDAIGGDELAKRSGKLATVAYDTAINLGPEVAKRMLKESGGNADRMLELRANKYRELVAAQPQKYGQYADGWQTRLDGLRALDQGAAPQDLGVGSDATGRQFARVSTRPEPTLGETAMQGFERGIDQSRALIGGFAALVSRSINGGQETEFQRKAMDYYNENMKEAQRHTSDSSSFTDVLDGNGSLSRWAADSAGYLGYQIAESLFTAGLGGVIGKTIGKGVVTSVASGMVEKEIGKIAATEAGKGMAREQVAKIAAANVARNLAAGTAVFVNNIRQEGGSIYGDALEQSGKTGEPIDLGRIWASTVAAAGVDTAADVAAARGVLGMREGSSAASYAGRAAREIPKGMLTQGGTEYGQTGLEYWGAGKDFFTPEGQKEGIDSAAVGAFGGVAAGVGSAVHRAEAPPVAAPNPLQHVVDAAAKPDSPLSRAALSGGQVPPAGPGGAAEQPAPELDAIGERANAVMAAVRQGDTLQKLRELGPQMGADNLANDFLYALQVARDPRNRGDQREQAIAQVEQALQWTTQGFGPGAPAAPGTAVAVRPDNAVAPAGQPQFFDANTVDGEATRVDNMLPGPRALPAPQSAVVPAGQPALAGPTPTAAPAATQEQPAPAEAGFATPSEQQTVGADNKTVQQQAAAATPATVAEMTQVAAPQVATPAGEGPAVLRKRKAVVQQLAGNGFESVVREGADFWMVNSKTGQKFQLDGPADAQLARKAIADRVDTLAHTAAASPKNDLLEPTPAQIEAGNYKKSEVIDLNGMRIKIENPQGSIRRGVGADGKAWETQMAHHYGEFQGTEGADGDKLDVFIGPRPDSQKVYVVDQRNADGSFDEHKVMMGFTSQEAARQGYLANYAKGWTGLGAITEMSVEQFKAWAKSRAAKKPAATAAAAQEMATGRADTRTAAGAADTATAIGFRPANERKRDVQRANAALELGNGGRILFAKADGDLVVVGPDGKEAGVVRFYDQRQGAIREASQFPAFVPQALREPLLAYQRAFYAQARNPSAESAAAMEQASGVLSNAVRAHAQASGKTQAQPQAGEAANEPSFLNVRSAKGQHKLRIVKPGELLKKASGERKGKYRELTQGEAKLIENVAAIMGKRVVFFEPTDAGFKTDGFVRPGEPGTIYVNKKTSINALAVFGHEFFHTLRETNPQAWEAIAAVVASKVKDGGAQKFRADRYGSEIAQQMGDGALSKDNGGELEELVSDLGGNLLKDADFWKEVFAKVQDDHPQEAKGILAQLAAMVQRAIASLVGGLQQRGFAADSFVKDLDQVRAAFKDAMAQHLKDSGLSQRAMAAEKLKAEQKLKKAKAAGDETVKASPAREGALSVTGYHFSHAPRATLSTGFFGAGLKGSARDEIQSAQDQRLRERISFYANKGTGVRPEAGVGAIAHKAQLDNIYDADADPLRLRSGDARKFEAAVLDAGYRGYLSRLEGNQPAQVVLLGKQQVKPEILGPRTAIEDAPVVPSAAKRNADLGDRIAGNRSLPSGSLTPARWSQALMAADPELAAQLLDIGALTGEAPMYKDELAAHVRELAAPIKHSVERAADEYAQVEAKYKDTPQWRKAPNGQPSRLSERQWVQVRTPSFKAWFGDWEKFAGQEGGVWNDGDKSVSKVVDDNGEPLVVYHGTDKGGFTQFNEPGGKVRGDLGIFTTSNEAMAYSYVRKGRAKPMDLSSPDLSLEQLQEQGFEFTQEDGGWVSVKNPDGYDVYGQDADDDGFYPSMEKAVRAANADIDPEGGPGVYALFLNLRNPEEDNFEGALWNGDREDQYQVRDENDDPIYDEAGRAIFDRETAEALASVNEGAEVQPADPHYHSTDDVVREAQRWADGAIIHDVIDDGGGSGYGLEPSDVFVAFKPEQVKSADYNAGSFSPSDSDILLSPARAKGQRAAQDPAIGDKTDVTRLPKGRAVPAEVAVGSLESSLKQAASKSYRRGRDLKSDIQDRVLAAARAARVNLSERTQATFRFLADMVKSDAQFALKSNENAVGWYDSKVSRAIGALSTIHPEINDDPRSRLAFLWALAVTSNGLKVDKNFELAESAYRQWKASGGKMPTDIGIGNAAGAINKGMAQYNELVDKVGAERLLKFMATQFTVGEIGRMLGDKPGGEWAGTPVRGAAILGPKIGNGFFSNLNGYFDALTMDRWLMRTWGRMTGTLLQIDAKAIADARKKLVKAIDAMTAEQRREMSKVIGQPVRKGMTQAQLAQAAQAVEKASMKADKREALQAAPATDRFRLDARNLHKTIDGQKEAPSGPAERNWIRAVFQDALKGLQADGLDMTMSDLQALLWYPERRLYDAAKSDEDVAEGYEDDEAPDYANAAMNLALANGADRTRVRAAMDAAEARGTVVGQPLTQAEKQAMIEEFRAPPTQQFQLAFEVAPNPDDQQATAAWNALSFKDRLAITNLVKDAVLADMADAVGVRIGKAVVATGGFEGQVNPSAIAQYKVTQVELAQARALAAALGIALEQKSVALIDGRAEQTHGLVRITLDKKADKHAAAIMAAISEQLPGLDGFTARGNNIDILNFSDLPTEEVAAKIETILESADIDAEGVISFGDVNSELVNEDTYEDQINGARPEAGREVLERARRARDRARQVVRAELRGRAAPEVHDGAAGARRADDAGAVRQSPARDGGRGEPDRRTEAGALAPSERAAQDQALKPLAGAPRIQGATGPDPRLVDVAERYARDHGIELRRQSEYVQADPQRGKRIAAAYDAMAHDPQNPRVKEAYRNLIAQTRAQYDALADAGYKFWFMDLGRPDNVQYVSSPWNAMRDLRANQQMGVFPTVEGFGSDASFDTENNPLLADTGLRWPIGGPGSRTTAPVLANDLFRAVHDAFGHGLEGAGFRADGEENAWQAHVRLFTGSAVGAITSETRGQNSWLNFGPHGDKNRNAKVEDTVFADQKTGLMPSWTWEEGRVGDQPKKQQNVYNQRIQALQDLIACLK